MKKNKMSNFFKNNAKKVLRRIRGDVDFRELIRNGLTVGENFDMDTRTIIDASFCWLISIGDNVTFAANVLILAHDASTKRILGYTKIGRVDIGNNVFIGANTTILPNVVIGNNCIIGAGSVVKNNIPCNCVAVGNPAVVVTSMENYIEKNKQKMGIRPVYDYSYTINKNVSNEKKEQMKEDLKSGIGYII